MSRYLIKNGRVVNPADKTDDILDILISDGKVSEIAKNIQAKDTQTIDASGLIVAPGFIDMHVHLREPGREDEETIRTGTRAAVRGGFATVCCMPNTEPAIDNVAVIKMVKDIIKKDAIANVFIIGAITEGRLGKKVNDYGGFKKEGVPAVSDDGSSVDDDKIMTEALNKSKKEGIIIIEHCEDQKLSDKGVMNKGFMSTKMGLRGISRESEWRRVARDIDLAKKASSEIHIAHVSCRESVDIIRKAKKAGVKVTAETAPHYFALTEECCATYDTNMKMNPPLRAKEDVEAIKEGLSDGTIDVIASDHAPHTDSEKDVEFDFAPFGKIGLESSLSVSILELIAGGVLDWPDLVSKFTINPARILGLKSGTLGKGASADITIIDPKKEYTITRQSLESKSRNSPFIGWKLNGKASHVFVAGKLIMKDEVIL